MGLWTQAAVLSLGDNPVTGDPTQASLKWLVHTLILTGSRVSQETTFWLVCQGFLNGVNSGGKTKPECGQRYPMDWDPGPNKKEKVIFISLLTDCGCKMASQF